MTDLLTRGHRTAVIADAEFHAQYGSELPWANTKRLGVLLLRYEATLNVAERRLAECKERDVQQTTCEQVPNM